MEERADLRRILKAVKRLDYQPQIELGRETPEAGVIGGRNMLRQIPKNWRGSVMITFQTIRPKFYVNIYN